MQFRLMIYHIISKDGHIRPVGRIILGVADEAVGLEKGAGNGKRENFNLGRFVFW